MPAKINPNDWNRLFAPNAPRRGGPLQALGNLIILFVVLALVGGGLWYGFRYREQQITSAIQTATVFSATNIPASTATAEAQAQETATRLAERTATAEAALNPTAAPLLGIGAVNQGGNLRSEPIVADGNVIGLIWQGDQIAFLEEREIDGQLWYRIRLTAPAPNRGGEGVPATTEGWAAGSLLSPIAPP